MVKVIFHYHSELLLKESIHFAPSGSKFFPLREIPFLKMGAVEENHCLIRQSPFDVR